MALRVAGFPKPVPAASLAARPEHRPATGQPFRDVRSVCVFGPRSGISASTFVSSTTVNYGVIDPDGNVNVRIIYDHRVMDGADAARALKLLELELTGATSTELRAAAS